MPIPPRSILAGPNSEHGGWRAWPPGIKHCPWQRLHAGPRHQWVTAGAVYQRPLPAVWYCSATLAGMRPRSLTARPCSFAQARMSPERWRLAAVCPGRRSWARPALPCSRNGASCLPNARRSWRSGRFHSPSHPRRTARSDSPGRRSDRLPARQLLSAPSLPPPLRWCLHRTQASGRHNAADQAYSPATPAASPATPAAWHVHASYRTR